MSREEQSPSNGSPEPILNPENSQLPEYQEPSSMGLKIAIVVFVLIAGLAAGYAWVQHDAAQQLAAERADLRTSLAQAKSQEDALTAKVNALSAAQAQEEAARAQAEAAKVAAAEAAKNEQFLPNSGEAPHHAARHVVTRRAPVEDPRWKQFQEQLGSQQKELDDSQKQIAQTQANLDQAKSELAGNLQTARTELGTDIARNHDEVVALQKKGERNFFEFTFEKSKTYHHTGPISIALRKADSKHEYCDLQLLVDDRGITRKHVNLYESISLYPEGYPAPVEVVINRIEGDSVHGYVSEPKYRVKPEQAAAAEPSAAPSAAPAPATTSASVNPPSATPDVKLEHR